MNFPFDLNSLFPERISVLDHRVCAAPKQYGRDMIHIQPSLSHGRSARPETPQRLKLRSDAYNQTATVIDELGKASAKAQQLPAPITSTAKLEANRHYLYLLKDRESNGGRGVVVGYLKVGYKKLFLLDQRGAHLETEPLCVLDFYVTESLQRHGYGLELFHFMLQHKKVEPEQMAYDRPSPKFLAFLEKHFDLKHSVPQVNNFVVFKGFFTNRSVVQLRKTPPKKPEGEIKPYSLMEREVVREEQKALPWPFIRSAAVPSPPLPAESSPFSRSLSVGSSPNRTPHPPRIPPTQLTDNCRAKRTSAHGLVARNNLYSRHVGSRGIERLKLPGLRPVLSEKMWHSGGRADAPGQKNTAQSIQNLGSPLCLPPLPVSYAGHHVAAKKDDFNNHVMVPGTRTAGEQRPGADVQRDGSSWTVGENCCTAQWVRQKHEHRSTRPW